MRRFGHAATDRKGPYLEKSRIQAMRDTCVLERAIYDAVERWNIGSIRRNSLWSYQPSFEPKVTLPEMIHRVSVPLAVVDKKITHRQHDDDSQVDEKPQVMRKHMTRCHDEILRTNKCGVYLGGDVRHGGYDLAVHHLSQSNGHHSWCDTNWSPTFKYDAFMYPTWI